MKPKERDDLLIKIAGDIGGMKEAIHNTYHLTEKLEQHNTEQNGYIREQGKQVASNKTHIWWIVRILIASGIIGGTTTGLINWLG